MGKKQHSKDRLFITRTEWNTEWGGYKEKKTHKTHLPFYCCALSLAPFEHPYCTRDGYVFDLTAILPYVKKNKSHPITGSKLAVKDLIKLKFYKNDDDEFHCPITRKIFNKSSFIVAISTTGNVYSYEAVKELNIQKNDYSDLMNNSPFTKKDIITIQNPADSTKQLIENFAHIHQSQNENNQTNEKMQFMNPNIVTNHAQIRHNSATKRVFAAIESENDKKGPLKKKMKLNSGSKLTKNKANKLGLTNVYSTGAMAASFTSTAMTPIFKDELQPYTEAQIREEKWRNVKGNGKKAYVRMVTNFGNLNFMLDCDYVPKTCYNFLTHCENGYYDDTIFHRNIMSFMIQGGDPEGSGHGGSCAWDTESGTFDDEFHKLLKHNERGILSMANSGPNENGSQFFILYQAAKHLDGKHSVFGRLVGGMDVLNRMEEVEVNEKNDKPLRAIKILRMIVYQNPFNDPLPHQLKEEKEKKEKEIEELNKEKGKWWSEPMKIKGVDTDENKFEIGKYIKNKQLLNERYGANGSLNLNKQQRRKKTKNRLKCQLPTPKSGNKRQKVTESVFRFKNFEIK